MIPIRVLLNPWVLAAGASAVGWALMKKSSKQGQKLDDARVELAEQERTIARLRAELARTRNNPPPAEPAH